jgi:outer membrane protein OmpA-like peptidoglycan-associated protein
MLKDILILEIQILIIWTYQNRRVNAAINYLVNTYGISRDRFVPGFYGEADNLFKNASKEAQHQLNRRVEFTPANY